ncbi:MAG: DUF2949 domain-containing protein [Gomphosphaeria aponina SAG 52.96 = DSM 107014]|uniref:DUF2949 domain-containing protein n=1 Tax=Gomphosphaeria aponina SAG 52.96 = DSM 107014 TaxID=1521640 RepID=A0A941JVI7_9CHRO|nr:DUF2949 domain-containing protein [Gomphosphaeria aponina SAG 52.96 = DSM 107014]
MKNETQNQFIQYLIEELAISPDGINLALRHAPPCLSVLPMVLWQYGLVNLQELERIWDWLETA